MKNNVIPFLVGVVTIVAAVFGLYIVTEAAIYAPDAGATATTAATTTFGSTTSTLAVPSNSALGYPSRLIIPSLNINANVQRVGVSAHGTVGTPNNFTDVAWYTGSVLPGMAGSALIDGHVDNGLGLAGVFKHLSNIATGDEINVVTTTGATLHYQVTSVTTYNYQSVPMSDLLTTSGAPTLHLVTCEGTWIGSQDTYNGRLVVTATLEQ